MHLTICRRLAVAAVWLVLIVPSGASAQRIKPARRNLPRPLTAPEEQVRSSANAFSFALWRRLNARPSGENIFVSPLSASLMLGMTMNGATGRTFDEMREALQLGRTPIADIDAGYKSLIGLLTSIDSSTIMKIASSVWYRNTVTFNKPFLNAAASSFDATVAPLDFDDAAGSLKTINGWVDAKTNHKIPSIVDEISDDNVMFLINAIYFKASWRTKFQKTATKDAPFHGTAGDRTVPLMFRAGDISYTETPAFQAVDLAYGDSSFAMTVILPRTSSNADTVAASLSTDTWKALVAGFAPGDVRLYLPRMTLTWEKSLIPELQALGVRTGFIPDSADFTGMSPEGRHLFISVVKQKAFVDVNEEGTEAAAATMGAMQATGYHEPTVVRVDRPFIFAIRERLTGTILFMGKVHNLP